MQPLRPGLSLTSVGYQLLMIGRRRQDLTPAQFRDHYENVHIPLMRNLTGDTFPLSHERHYVRRDDGNGTDGTFPAAVLIGTSQAAVDYDAVAILTYRDKAHFDANWAFFEDPETSKIIAADEAEFSEWTQGVFLQ
ncbi:EthD domain-containing protein [Apiospora aurea]|uniref:EthD domain-containing protein n=1 Tax=Apiospora aurea TaxID=335848 RepID=A0ABR1PY12_9PEZI